MIPYGRQFIDQSDVEAVINALQSDLLTTGPQVAAFEEEFAAFLGAKHAVAVANATDALHLAMRVAEIGPGDRVVTSPNTFLSSANCAAFVGAIPDFCDIEAIGYNIDPAILEREWKSDTKAVVAVDHGGQAANMPEIASIARRNGAIVIEDSCHGVGGGFQYDGRHWKLGEHPWADITTFSFHPVKTMTTGEGGMLVTNKDEIAKRARLLRSHGMEKNPDCLQGFGSNDPAIEERGSWVYEMQQLGYNHRITDLQCALGRSQLKKLQDFITRRADIVERYNEAFSDLSWLQIPDLAPWLKRHGKEHRISWHLYTVQINFSKIGKSRSEFMQSLLDKGVGSQVLYIPVYLQPWYRKTYGYSIGKCPVAENYYKRTLSLPLHPSMTDSDVQTVIDTIISIT